MRVVRWCHKVGGNLGSGPGPILDRLKSSVFLKNVTILASGTVMAQALAVAAAPILTRLYDPATFGVLGVFVAMVALVSLVAAWRYDLAIVLPKDDEDAANIFALGCSLVAFMTLLTALIMALAGDWIVRLLGGSEFAPIIWWLPVAVFAGGLFNVFSYWATRRKYFKRLTMSRISSSGGVAGTQIFAGLAGAGAAGLIGGNVAGLSLATVVLGAQIYREDRKLIYHTTNTNKLKGMALEHQKFPKYAVPQSMLNTVSQNLPVFLLTGIFDPAVAGLYWLTHRLLQIPSVVIGDAVARVFYQRSVEIYHKRGDLLPIFTRSTLGLVAISVIPTAVILPFAPVLFEAIFGSAWHQAGVYAQWLVVSWLFGFITRPSTMLIPVFGLQRLFLFFEITLLISRGLAISLGAYLGNDVTAVAVYAIVGVFFNIALVTYMFIAAKRGGHL